MPADPKKVAPRTLFESEVVKAEKLYKRWLKVIMAKIRRIIGKCTDYNTLLAQLHAFAGTKSFRQLCRQASRQIVTMLAVGQQHTWRQAASLSSNGRKIFLALQKELKTTPRGAAVQQIIDNNATLIQTVPQNVAQEFSRMAGEAQFAGMRPDELLDEFKKRAPHLTDAQIRRIARTETGKAATALMEARSEDLGLSLYVWSSVKDERVRNSHRKMDGVICAWDDPPNPEQLAGEKRTYGNYHPRCIFNCRCDPLVVVNLNDISYPARVHYHGSIRTIKNGQELSALFGRKIGRYRE